MSPHKKFATLFVAEKRWHAVDLIFELILIFDGSAEISAKSMELF